MSLTYDELLQRALKRVSSQIDTSEGSFLFDAIAPCVAELYEAYLYIEELEKRVFADTAYGAYLERRTAERGIYRKPATYAIRKAYFNVDVPIGSKWAKKELVYTVTEKIQDDVFLTKANQTGAIGNRYSGELVNMDFIENLNSAILEEVVIAGEDEEDDESLRLRYFSSFEKEAFGGNKRDYEEKIGSIDGVGVVKMTKDSWLHEYMVVDVAGRGETPTPLILHYTKSLKITHYARPGNYTATINFHFVINEYV